MYTTVAPNNMGSVHAIIATYWSIWAGQPVRHTIMDSMQVMPQVMKKEKVRASIARCVLPGSYTPPEFQETRF